MDEVILHGEAFYLNTNLLIELMEDITNVRRYADRLVEKEDLEKLYKAFSLGHSSVGNQARELLVIEASQLRKKIVKCTLNPYMIKASKNQEWLENVPFLGIVLIEKRRAIARVGEIGSVIAEREAEGALQNVRLIGGSLNIATTVVREFDVDVLKKELKLPWYVEPTAIIAAGYTIETTVKGPRLSIGDIVNKDRWA